jgi:hypothetical protein
MGTMRPSMAFAIRLTAVGQYLVSIEHRSAGGRRLIVTDDPTRARRWSDPSAARRFWADSGLPTEVPFEIDLLREAGAEVCDFCSAPDPTWVYPAREFHVTAYAWGSGGGWTGCVVCAELIEREDWPALAERAVDANPRLAAGVESGRATRRTLAIEAACQLHVLFRQARTGAPRRLLRPD